MKSPDETSLQVYNSLCASIGIASIACVYSFNESSANRENPAKGGILTVHDFALTYAIMNGLGTP